MNVRGLTPGRQPVRHPEDGPALPLRRALLLGGLMGGAAVAGEQLRPSQRLGDLRTRIELEQQVPEAFGDWAVDRGIRPVLPDPSLQATLDALYSQVLARTYINRQRERVMLSIAYGSDQSNEATAVHRPEFCYSAQGFRVQGAGTGTLRLGEVQVPVARLVARLGPRHEPITYWVTLDESATLPGVGRKLQQIRYGLRGEIPDGMLVRVSSLSERPEPAFALQQRFLEQMHAAVPAAVRPRYFGRTPAGSAAA